MTYCNTDREFQYSCVMKTVFVLRHGKSDWKASYGSDFERPLAKRGVRAAGQMGRFMTRTEQVPEKILSSTAVRARRTADLAIEAGEWPCPAEYVESLYGATAASALDLIRSQADEYSSLLIVGHQPTLSDLIAELSGGSWVRFPTAALVRIDFGVESWDLVAPSEGELIWLVTPKLLASAGQAV